MLSIITPVYNGERFIEGCIENVISQNCMDCEHLIIDGGSIDRTITIIKKYAAKYSHIRWISEQDRGQSDAMNKGIKMKGREIFKIEDNKITRLRRHCPKCGEGVFLAEHKDRLSCGKCGYTEFKGVRKKIPEEKTD